MIMDTGSDSDGMRKQPRRRGIEPIVQHCKGQRKPTTQDGLALRRYKRRWIVERVFAWLGNYRRLAARYDRSLTIYRGFFHIASFMIVLRRVLK
jgi:transposase